MGYMHSPVVHMKEYKATFQYVVIAGLMESPVVIITKIDVFTRGDVEYNMAFPGGYIPL